MIAPAAHRGRIRSSIKVGRQRHHTVARRCRQAPVGGDERRPELIGESHEGCVVAGQGAGGGQAGSARGQRLAHVMHAESQAEEPAHIEEPAYISIANSYITVYPE
jgi:hypothetical protein